MCSIGKWTGGAGGIRTLDRPLQAYNGLANRRLQPLGHSSMSADMPDGGLSRKQQIEDRGGRRFSTAPSYRLRLYGQEVRAFCATSSRNLCREASARQSLYCLCMKLR